MRLVGRSQTPESIAAGIICRRGPEVGEKAGGYLIELIDAVLDWHWTLLGWLLDRMFRVEGRHVHATDSLKALIAGAMVGLLVLVLEMATIWSYESGRSQGWFEHAKAQSSLRR